MNAQLFKKPVHVSMRRCCTDLKCRSEFPCPASLEIDPLESLLRVVSDYTRDVSEPAELMKQGLCSVGERVDYLKMS